MNTDALLSDAAGLNHPPPTFSKASRGGRSRSRAEGKKTQGSISTAWVREILKVRFAVLRRGGSVSEAAAIGAVEAGKTVAEIRAIYDSPGFEPLPIFSSRKFTASNDDDLGVIGLVSSSRVRQRTRSWWANFGHSLQGFWDVGRGPAVAVLGVLNFPELACFVDHFKAEFGAKWKEALKEDVDRCYQRFGQRQGLRPVSAYCLDRIRNSLASGAASAPVLAKRSHFSVKQTQRALYELARLGEVVGTGKNKGKKWLSNASRISGHTEDIRRERRVRVNLGELTPQHHIPGSAPLLRRVQPRPIGCPPNQSGLTREAYNRQRREAAKARKAGELLAKNTKSENQIHELWLDDDCKSWWLGRLADYRLIRSAWGQAWVDHEKFGRAGSRPLSLEVWLRKEWMDGESLLLPRIKRARARAAAKTSKKAKVKREKLLAEKAAAAERDEEKRERYEEREVALHDAAEVVGMNLWRS